MTLPNFLIIGERRSGTSNLARWIEIHPDIYLNPRLDIGYFIDKELVGTRNWKAGKADYAKWDAEHSKLEYSKYFQDVKDEKVIGEKSADYLFWKPAHSRIKSMLPNTKLVITLRNPIQRAYSMYWNELGKGREDKSFGEAIKLEKERTANSDYAKNHLSYVTRGYYDESLLELYKTFKKEDILVVILEELIQKPVETLKTVYNFLGVDEEKGFDNINKRFNANWTLIIKPFWKENKLLSLFESLMFSGIQKMAKFIHLKDRRLRRKLTKKMAKPFRYSKDDVKISQTDRKILLETYRPHIKKLELILNKDLSVWLKD